MCNFYKLFEKLFLIGTICTLIVVTSNSYHENPESVTAHNKILASSKYDINVARRESLCFTLNNIFITSNTYLENYESVTVHNQVLASSKYTILVSLEEKKASRRLPCTSQK